MSQQAAEFEFCGDSRVKAAAETVRAAPHARAITSALNFFISMSPGRRTTLRENFANGFAVNGANCSPRLLTLSSKFQAPDRAEKSRDTAGLLAARYPAS